MSLIDSFNYIPLCMWKLFALAPWHFVAVLHIYKLYSNTQKKCIFYIMKMIFLMIFFFFAFHRRSVRSQGMEWVFRLNVRQRYKKHHSVRAGRTSRDTPGEVSRRVRLFCVLAARMHLGYVHRIKLISYKMCGLYKLQFWPVYHIMISELGLYAFS